MFFRHYNKNFTHINPIKFKQLFYMFFFDKTSSCQRILGMLTLIRYLENNPRYAYSDCSDPRRPPPWTSLSSSPTGYSLTLLSHRPPSSPTTGTSSPRDMPLSWTGYGLPKHMHRYWTTSKHLTHPGPPGGPRPAGRGLRHNWRREHGGSRNAASPCEARRYVISGTCGGTGRTRPLLTLNWPPSWGCARSAATAASYGPAYGHRTTEPSSAHTSVSVRCKKVNAPSCSSAHGPPRE